jgi:hypothetical protein
MAHIQVTAKKIGQYQPLRPKLVLIELASAKVKHVSSTEAEIVMADNSQTYTTYENARQIQMLQDPSSSNPFFQDKTTTITAGATQTQAGATALTKYLNVITTCATSGDGVALPAAAANKTVVIINNGAASARVWPANGSGAKIDLGTANAADTNLLASQDTRTYVCLDGTNWTTVTY